MKLTILAVGDELLLGDVVNTNASWLGRRLTDEGYDVTSAVVVGDRIEDIADALRTALPRCAAVVVTGGLGPTADDLTREGLAAVAGVGLQRDAAVAATLSERFARAGGTMPASNLRQAEVPEGAAVLPNHAGTAPGLRMTIGETVVYAVPGVPHEMTAVVERSVLPDLRARADAATSIVVRTLRTVGMTEAAVGERVAALSLRGVDVAYLAGGGEVAVRLLARGTRREPTSQVVAAAESSVRAALVDAIYGADEDRLDHVVHRALRARAATVATAESLTGGMLGARLTEMPGASLTYRGGVVSYATELKESLAGVPGPLLEAEGPVSADVAAAMAAGVRERLGATYGVSLTGVAGPEPQAGHPVGTVHIGLAGPDGGTVRSMRLPGDRELVRRYAVTAALAVLWRHLAT